MNRAWPVAMAILLLLAAPAEARKRCRTVPADPVVEEEPQADARSRWPHDASSDWVHRADDDWHHEGDYSSASWATDVAAYDPKAGTGWVHETDYGWWAAVPEASISSIDQDPNAEEEEEDCTVSKERNECVVLANQVATYHFRLGLAREREDALWEASIRETIERLENRAELYGCPWVEPSLREKIEQTAEAVARAVGVAAQVAALFYRMGLF